MTTRIQRNYLKPGRIGALALILILMIITASSTRFVTAQSTGATPSACTRLLALIEKNMQKSCNGLDRDQICYGNDAISVKFKDQGTQNSFAKVGDIVPITAVTSITTSPLNPDTNKWGLAVFKVRADVPNSTANQAVTFIVYGDTTLTNKTVATAAQSAVPAAACSATTSRVTSLVAEPAGTTAITRFAAGMTLNIHGRSADGKWALAENAGSIGWVSAQNLSLTCDLNTMPAVNPSLPDVMPNLHTFYFSTDVSAQSMCQDVPSGLLIKSQNGSKVTFNVNGADMTIGSSIVLQAQPKKAMQVKVIRGHATITSGGKEQTVTTGQELNVPLGGPDGLEADGPPSAPEQIPASDTTVADSCAVAQSASADNPCDQPQPADQAVPTCEPNDPICVQAEGTAAASAPDTTEIAPTPTVAPETTQSDTAVTPEPGAASEVTPESNSAPAGSEVTPASSDTNPPADTGMGSQPANPGSDSSGL